MNFNANSGPPSFRIFKYQANPIFTIVWPLHQTDHDSQAIDTPMSNAFALIARAITETPNNDGILRGFGAVCFTVRFKYQARTSQLMFRDLTQSSRLCKVRTLVDHRNAVTGNNELCMHMYRQCVLRRVCFQREFAEKKIEQCVKKKYSTK